MISIFRSESGADKKDEKPERPMLDVIKRCDEIVKHIEDSDMRVKEIVEDIHRKYQEIRKHSRE